MTNKLAWLRASGRKGEATDAAAACGLPARQTNLKIVWQNYALMSARSAPFHWGVVRRSEEGAFLRANNAGKFVASAQPSAIQIPIPIHKMPNSVLRDRPRPLANFAESD